MAYTIWHRKWNGVPNACKHQNATRSKTKMASQDACQKDRINLVLCSICLWRAGSLPKTKQCCWLFTDLPDLLKGSNSTNPCWKHALQQSTCTKKQCAIIMKCWIQPQKIRRTWLYPSSNLAISFQYLSCWWWGICGDLRSVRPSLIIEHHIDVSEHKHVHSCWPWTNVFAGLPQNFHVNPTSFKQRWSDPNFVPPRLTSDQLVEGHRPNQSPNHPKPPKLRLQDDPANTLTSRLGYQTFQRWFNHDNTISMPRIKIRCFHAFCSSSLKAIHDLYPQGQDPSTIDLASYHQRVAITITPSHHHSIIVSALPSSRFWWVLEPLTYFSGTAFAPGMNCIHLPTATSHPGSREQKWLNNTAAIKMDRTIKWPLLITRMNRIHPYIYI